MSDAAGGSTEHRAGFEATVVPRWNPAILISDRVRASGQIEMLGYRSPAKYTAPAICFSEPQPLLTLGGTFLTLAERSGLIPGSTYLTDGRWREALAGAASFRLIDGAALVAGNAVIENHYHWLLQALAPILVAERHGIAPGAALIVPPLKPVQWESLLAAGIDRGRVIELPPGEAALPERGIHSNLTAGDFAFAPHPTTIDSFDLVARPEAPSRWSGQRVYIARFDGVKRRLVDEQALCARLEAMGFAIVVASELGFSDQVSLFRDAALIVAQHGAALANMLFSPGANGPHIVELLQENYINLAFVKLGQVKRSRYTAIVNPVEDVGADVHQSTWRADVPLIERTLAAL